jgi:hypothetical protein
MDIKFPVKGRKLCLAISDQFLHKAFFPFLVAFRKRHNVGCYW